MSEHIIPSKTYYAIWILLLILTGVWIGGIIVLFLIFGMKYFSAARQARLGIASEAAHRDLVEKAIAAQSAAAALLVGIHADVAEVKAKLAAIEKVLREVE